MGRLKVSPPKWGLRALSAILVTTVPFVSFMAPTQALATGSGTYFEDKSAAISSFDRSGIFYIGGVAWLDYNNDGYQDLFLPAGYIAFPGFDQQHNNALFKNNGDGTFTDVAVAAGVANGFGNTGVAAGDLDNDGCIDLVAGGNGDSLTFLPQTPVTIYHNNCNGTFTNINPGAGVNPTESVWGVALGDVNNDGFLDIFFAEPGNFGQPFGPGHNSPNYLFKNNGNLTFTDVSAGSGVDTALGSCVGSFTDYDYDGKVDLLVGDCNKVDFAKTPVHLFHNDGNFHFTDKAQEVGITDLGYWQGMAIGDYNGDARNDFFFANTPGNWLGSLHVTPHALFTPLGNSGKYKNVSSTVGLPNTAAAWGANLSDFNNDGHVDLLLSGTYQDALSPFPVVLSTPTNPGRFLLNDGSGQFTSAQTFGLDNVLNSGMAVADYDNDGFLDAAILTTDTFSATGFRAGSPVLLHNTGNSNKHLTVKLQGTTSNKSGIGARVTVYPTNGDKQMQEVRSGSSFASMDTLWLNFGLGNSGVDKVKVEWPSGRTETFKHISSATVTLVEGTGE